MRVAHETSGLQDPVLAVRTGDGARALGEFFDAAISEVYPYLIRRCGYQSATAEDLTQETFATAVRAMHDGRVEQLTIGWLMTCARSRFIDHCRRETVRERHLVDVSDERAASPEDGVIDRLVLTELLTQLSASQRLVVVLHDLDDLAVADVANRIGRTVRATESLLARARRRLQALAKERIDAT